MQPRAIDVLKRVYERWAVGDFASMVDAYDPEVVFVMRPQFPDAGTYRGVERVAAYTRGFLEPWEHIAIEAEEIVEAGDSFVVAVRQHGTGKGSGVETELRYFHVWTFRGTKAIRLESVRERSDALGAVGLRD
jgi:ketosteroid isomerase-like protein